MTDYLEEHLGSAETLLERIRRLEQSTSSLSGKAVLKENADKLDNFDEKVRDVEEKSRIVSKEEKEVYNMAEEVNYLKESVDNLDINLEIHGKERDIDVNYRMKTDDNRGGLGQLETASKPAETGAQTNAERAENSSPLSVQLEELDRAVSALTTLAPEGQSGYPVSLSPLRDPEVDPTITGVPDTPAGSGFAYGGAQSWAEQADRMFRRDSRRYDGGFYLY